MDDTAKKFKARAHAIQHKPYHKWSPTRIDDFLKRLEEGDALSAIAADFGITTRSIYSYIYRLKLSGTLAAPPRKAPK